MKAGRPSKFTPDLKKQMRYLAETKGFTEQEIADALLIDQSTITKFKQRNPKFFTALKEWKDVADRNVQRCLYERACGFKATETKVFLHNGEVITHDIQREYPPDPASAIFWLKNRQPEKWREKQVGSERPININIINYSSEDGGKRVINITPDKKEIEE